MEVGGVERSLISMLNNFNYHDYQTDLMLYSHTGDFINLLHQQVNLLEEMIPYKTFRMTMTEIIKSRQFLIALARILAKYRVSLVRSEEKGYQQMQFMWKYTLPFLPRLNKEYDVAISYLWPHYFVAKKVKAKTKIAWIHTDFSTVNTNIQVDLDMWKHFNHIVAVSEQCKQAFIKKYPTLEKRTIVIENITSPNFVQTLAQEKIDHPIMDDQRFKIVTVARLSYAKGIDRAIKALELLKQRGYEDIVWYVVGYGGDEAMLERLIAEKGLAKNFILLGKAINPYPFMKVADLYVQPSRYEGKAVTVGEAQILAKPVLITNYPTAASQVINQFDGLICEQSIEGIAAGIEKLYNDQSMRNMLISNCKQTNYENSHDELKKLYELV
jgi:glycosyltransferase involved in cell wall biosynthesis